MINLRNNGKKNEIKANDRVENSIIFNQSAIAESQWIDPNFRYSCVKINNSHQKRSSILN